MLRNLEICGFILLGIFLRFFGLGRDLGGGDENQFLLEFANSPLTHILTTFSNGTGGNHMFHTVVVHGMMVFFGEDNPYVVRVPAFASGVGTLYLTYKTALILFKSSIISRLSLLAITVCPSHIYYSQTARGYSLSIFLCLLCLYAALKILDQPKNYWWTTLFIFSGYLAMYTIPSNSFFILGLAIWIGMVLAIPAWASQFGQGALDRNQTIAAFFTYFLIMSLLTVLTYWPVMDQMFSSASSFYSSNSPYTSSESILIHLIPDIFVKIFPGISLGFIPILFLGICKGSAEKSTFRFLPVSILLAPFFLTLVIGFSWRPRVYLFNVPLFAIFLGAGIAAIGHYFHLSKNWKLETVAMGLGCFFAIISIWEVANTIYLDINTSRGQTHKWVEKNLAPFDLLMIVESNNFLFGRKTYKQRLYKILTGNRLDGIKILKFNSTPLRDYWIRRGQNKIFILDQFEKSPATQKLENKEVLELISLFPSQIKSLLPEDFEMKAVWNNVSGNGKFNKVADRKLSGDFALQVEAGSENLIGYAIFPEVVHINKESLILLTWAGHNLGKKTDINHPEIGFIDLKHPKKGGQLALGEINDGIKAFWRKPESLSAPSWLLISSLARLSSGDYSLSLWINTPPREKVVYDGFAVYLIELS